MNDLDVERLLGSVINGALGGRRKRSRGARRYLTGGKRSFLNASTLMTLAGVAWGVWEAANRPAGGATPPSGGPPPAPAPSGGRTVPPPLPTAPPPVSPAPVVPPPLPGAAGSQPAAMASLPTAGGPEVTRDVLRVLRLTLSAARADGTLTGQEREAILTQARAVGAESIVSAELDRPHPLAEIVAGVDAPEVRHDLYTLAFSIVRADEAVTDAERAYLTELAGHLGIGEDERGRLEQQAAERIRAAAEGADD